jgi:hypothetical protein
MPFMADGMGANCSGDQKTHIFVPIPFSKNSMCPEFPFWQ